MTLKNRSIINNLRQSHLFSNLSDIQIERIYNHCDVKQIGEGQQLFAQGEAVNSFFMVSSGKMKLFRVSEDGQEKIFEIIKSGGTFAEALMFMDQPVYPVSSAALLPTVLVCIDARDFKEMLWDSIETCFLLMGDMSLRLRKQIHEIEALTLHNGTCRIASYLLKKAPADQNTYKLDNAKVVIASRLSVKPETFSRIIKNLRDKNIVTIEGKSITIQNRQALQELCLME